MCGRFTSATDADDLVRFFAVEERKAAELPSSWNVAPTTEVYAVAEHDARRTLVSFRWGLVPHWADDPRIGSKLINARAETVASKPAFRDSLARRRCLIPADGFYEWQRQADGTRVPYFVRRVDGAPMALAGLWASWRDKGAQEPEWLRTCAIVTTNANDSLRPLHQRMPVVLEADAWDLWLDRDVSDADALTALLLPADDDVVTAHRVSTDVNNVRNDHPGLVEPSSAA